MKSYADWVGKTNDTFIQVADHVDQTVVLMREIADAASSQSQSIEEIRKAANDIHDLVTQK